MQKKLTFVSLEDWGGLESTSFYMKLKGFGQVKTPEEADIIIFNGGADIGTEIYGEVPVMDRIPLMPSNRDRKEIAIFEQFKGKKFMFGICRGAQLLNCLNGGTLWQHVDNHGYDHLIADLDTKKTYFATSTHHQMMRPNKSAAKIVAVASESTVKLASVPGTVRATKRDSIINGEDMEIIWYKDTRSLCIQGHPEYVPSSPFANYCTELLNKHYAETENVAA